MAYLQTHPLMASHHISDLQPQHSLSLQGILGMAPAPDLPFRRQGVRDLCLVGVTFDDNHFHC